MKTKVHLTYMGIPVVLEYDGDYLERIGSLNPLTATEHEKLCKYLLAEGFLNSLNTVR